MPQKHFFFVFMPTRTSRKLLKPQVTIFEMESLVIFLTAPNKKNGLRPDFSYTILLKISNKIIQEQRGEKVNTEANTPYLEVSVRKDGFRVQTVDLEKMANHGFFTVFTNFGRENQFFHLSRPLQIITGSSFSQSAFLADRERGPADGSTTFSFSFYLQLYKCCVSKTLITGIFVPNQDFMAFLRNIVKFVAIKLHSIREMGHPSFSVFLFDSLQFSY